MENQLMVADEKNMLMNLTTAVMSYCSFNPKTQQEKAEFFNMVNNPEKRLKEMVNLEIELRDIYAEQCEFVNAETGAISPGVRIVFIDTNGVAYQAASKGIFTSTQKLLQIMGEPRTWKEPVKIRIKEVSKAADRNVLVFELVA